MSTNKRKLFSKKTKNTVNKKIATGDTNDEESKKEEDNIPLKTKQKNVEIIPKSEDIDQKQRLLVIQDKTAELVNKLNELKSEYEQAKKDNIEQINSTNIELDKKIQELKNLGKENKILINRLKTIEKNLNEKFIKAMDIKHAKKNNDINSENAIKKDIEVKEEEIKILKKEGEAIEEIYNNKIKKLNKNIKELQNLEAKIKKVEEEIKELPVIPQHENRKILKEIRIFEIDKNRKKIRINLEEKLKEHQTEKEKNLEDLKENHKKLKEKEKITNILSDPSLVEKYNYGKIIRDEILKVEFPRVKPASKAALRYINTEFDIINQENRGFKKRIGTQSMPKSVIDNVYKPQDNLFTERESKILENILKKEDMKNYVDKFDKIKKEKDKIEENLKKHNDNIIKNKEKKMCDIDFLKMEDITQDRKESELNIKISKNNKKISDLKIEIFEIKKQLDQQTIVLKRKDKQNKVYLALIENYKKNKNKNESKVKI